MAFEEQIKLAQSVKKPLFLHERAAFDDFYKQVRKIQDVRAVVHCFTGSANQAEYYIQSGFYIGLTGYICNSQRAHDTIAALTQAVPLDRIMIETDCPYMSPVRGRRDSTPADVWYVAKELSTILGLPMETIVSQVYENTLKFFEM